jgi:hypothetical protein
VDISGYLFFIVKRFKNRERERERERREEKESGEMVRDTIFGVGGKKLYLRL